MQMHQIEIDNEVYTYLKSKAEPFVDTPNNVLRRELFHDKRRSIEKMKFSDTKNNELTKFPSGTPKVLEHILQVVNLVRNWNYTRIDATHRVAAKAHVTYQTIVDQYSRQLHLRASQFDRWLEQPNLPELRASLKEKFKEHHAVIEEYLNLYTRPNDLTEQDC